jgi:dihydroorotate dehydrogenase electron transfer subunit
MSAEHEGQQAGDTIIEAIRPHRDTIELEQARVLAHEDCGASQYILRLAAPRVAARAEPGSFVHVSCSPELPMRRPLSIMRADRSAGWIDLLYKVVGRGTAALAARRAGDELSCIGPIGRGFQPDPARPRALLIGGGVGIPPMVFLAERLLRDARAAWQPLVLMGSEIPFPFRARPSRIMVPGLPAGVIAAMPMLDDWGVATRLASGSGFAGCHEGHVTQLAALWLDGLPAAARAEVAIYACGPTPMLAAVAAMARERQLPAWVSLEEYMACAVGGCAGCAVQVQTAEGPAMKRVCVDGPVFDAASVFSRS